MVGAASAGCQRLDRDPAAETTPAAQSTGQANTYVVQRTDDGLVQAVDPDGRVAYEDEASAAVSVAQAAYDDLARGHIDDARAVRKGVARQGGELRFAPGEYPFADSLDHYASKTSVSGPGATIVPTEGYSGYLLSIGTAAGTIPNDPGNQYDAMVRWLTIDGRDRAKGIKIRELDRSMLGPCYLRRTDGPGLDIGRIRESSFLGPVMRYCGSEEEASITIGPREKKNGRKTDAPNNLGFYYPVSAYPSNQLMDVWSDGSLTPGWSHTRHVHVFGGQLHGGPAGEAFGGRQGRPEELISVRGANFVRFIGGHLLLAEGAVLGVSNGENGEGVEGLKVIGSTLLTAIKGASCIRFRGDVGGGNAIVGADFGFRARTDYGIDWGDGDFQVAMSDCDFDVDRRKFLGRPPANLNGARLSDARDIETGLLERWDDGQVGAHRLQGTTRSTIGPVPKRVRMRTEWAGDAVAGDDHMRLPAGRDGEQRVRTTATNQVVAGAWDVVVQPDGSPSAGEWRFAPLHYHDDIAVVLRGSSDGSLVLEKREGDATALVEGSWPASGDRQRIRITRRPTEGPEWTLAVDGSTVGSTVDDYLPPTPPEGGGIHVVNAMDVPLAVHRLEVG
jgi:hypothetical protein